jgi:transposase
MTIHVESVPDSHILTDKALTCYGIDIGNEKHVAARRNATTPVHYRKRRNDLLTFTNDAEGFAMLLSDIREHGGPESCIVLIEPTGHYSFTLRWFLRRHHVTVYVIQPKAKYGKHKNDKRDARALADISYNQLVLHAIPADEREHIHSRLPPIEIARQVRGLVYRLCEREKRQTQLANKLQAITNQLFPEKRQIYKSAHSPSAIALAEQYPTPHDVARASLDDLCATRLRHQPSRAELAQLQELARVSVGLTEPITVSRLIFEQHQIIEELRLLNRHIEQIKARIMPLLDESREAQILMSFPGVSYTNAAILLASIGNFENFETYGDLCGLAGWRPFQSQTGTTKDSSNVKKTGNMLLKRTMSLIVYVACRYDPTWKALYQRLVKRKCHYDANKKEFVGKSKVVGRVAGQMLRVMFRLIKRDYALIARTPEGAELPPPELYDASRHHVRMK